MSDRHSFEIGASGRRDRQCSRYVVDNMPKFTNTSGKGKIDHVLWDDDGMPLAVVEAKRAIESVNKGENQAQLYAECLEKKFGRKLVMSYSNGYEIFLWDSEFYKQARKVYGYYTKAELQTLMYPNQPKRYTHRADRRKYSG